LKPDVSHLVTDPDVFVPGETYVPLAWDFSDLADKVDYYVRHEDERRAISENAYTVIHQYLTEGRFADFAGRIFAS
jgi:spore maturation protein CgeB